MNTPWKDWAPGTDQIQAVIVDGKMMVSDGFHTFDELYEHRFALFLALCRVFPHLVYWKPDGLETPGWFLAYLELPTGQISYHLPIRLIKFFRPEQRDLDHEWDRSTSKHHVNRLYEFAGIEPGPDGE